MTEPISRTAAMRIPASYPGYTTDEHSIVTSDRASPILNVAFYGSADGLHTLVRCFEAVSWKTHAGTAIPWRACCVSEAVLRSQGVDCRFDSRSRHVMMRKTRLFGICILTGSCCVLLHSPRLLSLILAVLHSALWTNAWQQVCHQARHD